MRCSSDGESGVATSTGRITGRQHNLHNPNEIVTFSLPIHDRIDTFYVVVGYWFEWILGVLSVAVWVYVVTAL
jgi:apolipoprotein N-acyltransferase